ncbi:MAG: hypothetical protein Q4P66_02820 [Actinomycetaceae bacterium]|nr:hypothetical protein [Actinomycetaceae bacterium]
MITFRRFGIEPGCIVPEKDQYRLVVSPLCPWCRRVAITRRLTGLEGAIALSESTGVDQDGFVFTADSLSFDPTLRVRSVRELYRRQPEWKIGEPTAVPLIVDKAHRIVAAESGHLMMDFITQWSSLHTRSTNLYPQGERERLDAIDRRIDTLIAATVSAAYSANPSCDSDRQAALCDGLDWADAQLSLHSYIAGKELRESDIRLFANLTSLVAHNPDMTGVEQARPSFDALSVTGGDKQEPACCASSQVLQTAGENLAKDSCQMRTASATMSTTRTEGGQVNVESLEKAGLTPFDNNDCECLMPWPNLRKWWIDLAKDPLWLSETEICALG